MAYEPISFPLPIDWRPTLAAIDDVLYGPEDPITHRRIGPSNPALARAAASLHRDVAGVGAGYDVAITNNVVTIAQWQADLDDPAKGAMRAKLTEKLPELYAAGQLAMLFNQGGWPWNPDLAVEAFSLSEMPIARASIVLTDNSSNPVLSITARETGLVGNAVQVGIVDTGSGLRLDARRGSTVFSCDVPTVGASFVTNYGRWNEPSSGAGEIGSLLERPTWIVGASNPPAVTAGWASLPGGSGALLGRILAPFVPLYPGTGLLEPLYDAIRVRLVNDGGVLRPVPSGLFDEGPGVTIRTLHNASFYLRAAIENANRVLAVA